MVMVKIEQLGECQSRRLPVVWAVPGVRSSYLDVCGVQHDVVCVVHVCRRYNIVVIRNFTHAPVVNDNMLHATWAAPLLVLRLDPVPAPPMPLSLSLRRASSSRAQTILLIAVQMLFIAPIVWFHLSLGMGLQVGPHALEAGSKHAALSCTTT